MADKDGKTEKPTPKRLRDTRKKGNVSKSQDLIAAATLLIFGYLLVPMWQYVTGNLGQYLVHILHLAAHPNKMASSLPQIGLQAILIVVITIAPFLVISLALGLILNFMQVGLLITLQPLKPDFKKLNPLNGLKQMLGIRGGINLVKNLAKFGLIGYICWQQFLQALPDIMNLSTAGTPQLLKFVLQVAQGLTVKIGWILLILGVVDYFYQRFRYRKDLRMTKQEIKEEMKQAEGDPQIKAQRRARYQALVRNTIAKVKEATVVVTNPTHFAIAIQYDPEGLGVPVVLAKGADQLAQRMKAEARKHDIPMIENRLVARTLYRQVEAGDPVPADLYEAVAGIIAVVYRMRDQQKHKI